MNMKLAAVSLAMLAVMCESAMANVVHLVGQSVDQEPLSVVYQIAHQDSKGPTAYSKLIRTQLSGQAEVTVDLGKYDYAGVVIVSVNGHRLPSNVTQFGRPKQCTMATDKSHQEGKIILGKQEKSLSCSVSGGTFIHS